MGATSGLVRVVVVIGVAMDVCFDNIGSELDSLYPGGPAVFLEILVDSGAVGHEVGTRPDCFTCPSGVFTQRLHNIGVAMGDSALGALGGAVICCFERF